MYYLQSRYYDPNTGRFLNADAFTSTGQGLLGCNMFAYCGNSPVIFVDHLGLEPSIAQGLTPEVALVMVLGAASIVAFSKAITPPVKPTLPFSKSSVSFTTQIEDEIGEIASAYGTYHCQDAAKSIADYLKKNGKNAEIVSIVYTGGLGFIWSDIKRKTISENGIHVGILYNGIVYCNVHPFGLPEMIWVEDFHGTGEKLVTKIPI